ncbi:hypothetical protein RHCRD62_110079 [Rhodococcus sp. RD6.2]|nr:hypothetical protein RHCRD62_110079 [Rhodococcus sp. RD6.2]
MRVSCRVGRRARRAEAVHRTGESIHIASGTSRGVYEYFVVHHTRRLTRCFDAGYTNNALTALDCPHRSVPVIRYRSGESVGWLADARCYRARMRGVRDWSYRWP